MGKSALAEALHRASPRSFVFDAEAVGNAVRDNMPAELFNGWIFEEYPLWLDACAAMLRHIASRYGGDIYVPMTLIRQDSFGKIARPLREAGVCVRHILLESTYELIRGRILARGEEEGCWCMEQIGLCLERQKEFRDVIRIGSYGKSVDELVQDVQNALKKL